MLEEGGRKKRDGEKEGEGWREEREGEKIEREEGR